MRLIPPSGYTLGMKIAISIPQDVFAQAEQLARRLKKSRSQLYSEAVAEYTARHSPDEMIEAINQAYAEPDPETDAFVAAAARRTLEQVEW